MLKTLFRDKILEKVQEKFEQLMEAEREAFLEEEEGQEDNSKNGFYERNWDHRIWNNRGFEWEDTYPRVV